MKSSFILSVLNIFYPIKCIYCGKYGLLLCQSCYDKINFKSTSICPECGTLTKEYKYCLKCRRKFDISLDSLTILTDYSNPVVKELIWNFKFMGCKDLSRIIGDIFIAKAHFSMINFHDCVVAYVPLSNKKQKLRGFNQSEEIAKNICEKLGLFLNNSLKTNGCASDQIGLSRQERKQNMIGKFFVADNSGFNGKTVFLIDDVVTTGATLNECARVLKKAGAKKVHGFVLAKNFGVD